MGDIATYVNGYAFKPQDWSFEGMPIIRIQNLNDASAVFNRYAGEIDEKYQKVCAVGSFRAIQRNSFSNAPT